MTNSCDVVMSKNSPFEGGKGDVKIINKIIQYNPKLKVIAGRFENRLVLQEPEFVKNEIRKTFKMKDP